MESTCVAFAIDFTANWPFAFAAAFIDHLPPITCFQKKN